MNLLTAFVMLTILAWVGMPKLVDNQFTIGGDTKVAQHDVLAGYIVENSPSQQMGLQRGDILVSVQAADEDMRPIETAEMLPKITEEYAGQEVALTYVREGEERRATMNLLTEEQVRESRNTDNPQGHAGVTPIEYT